MAKGKYVQVEYGIVGFLVGTVFALLYFELSLISGITGAITGMVLGVLLGTLYRRQSERVKLQIKFGTAGLLAGAMIGVKLNFYMWQVQMVAGAIIGAVVFAFLISWFIEKQMAKDRYLSFSGEAMWISLTGLAGTWTGLWIYKLIEKGNIWFPVPGDWVYNVYGVLIPLLVCLLFALPFGFMVAVNRFRPLIGGLAAMFGGLLVLWVGISIAPILFMPGSGLYWAGMAIGLMICTFALMGMIYPSMHIVMGALTVVFSVLSMVGAAGGFMLGCILGIMGGSLMVAWNGLPGITLPKDDIQQQITTQG